MPQNTQYTIATIGGVESKYTSKIIWESAIDRMIISRRERGIDTTRILNDNAIYFFVHCPSDTDTINFYDCRQKWQNKMRKAV